MKKRAKKSSLKKNVKEVKKIEKKKSSFNFVNAEKEKTKKKEEKAEESELEEEIKKVEKKIAAEEFRGAVFPSLERIERKPPILERMGMPVQEEQPLEESVSSAPLSENSGINYSPRFRTNYETGISANPDAEKYQTDSGAKIIRPRRETMQIPEIEIGNLSREMNPWEIKVNDEMDSRIKTTITDKRKRLPFESPEEKYREYELER